MRTVIKILRSWCASKYGERGTWDKESDELVSKDGGVMVTVTRLPRRWGRQEYKVVRACGLASAVFVSYGALKSVASGRIMFSPGGI